MLLPGFGLGGCRKAGADGQEDQRRSNPPHVDSDSPNKARHTDCVLQAAD